MFEFINDEEERGQVGIGTLIVFIAMVLVAAIAAGVLINTAGVLQTQAEDTGQDSTDQVANNINVIGSVGEVGPDSGGPTITNASVNKNYGKFANGDQKVHTVRLTVQKSAGAGDIDLSGLSIQYVGPDSFANIVHAEKAKAPEIDGTNGTTAEGEEAYFVREITAESTDTVMTSESDRYEIVIPVQQAFNSSTGEQIQETVGTSSTYDNTELALLDESSNVELTITTPSGSQRYVNLQVPDSLVGDGGGTVQL
jgi:flagellin FlaB